jgi:hypothetical protein
MVIGTVAVAVVLWASVALNVTDVADIAVVGVPVIKPPVLRLNPAGSVPAETVQLYGSTPPVAVNWLLYGDEIEPYAAETKPSGRFAVVATRGARASVE